MKLIHYGHDKYIESEFDEIRNQDYHTKPLGGLWCNRPNHEYKWVSWCNDNNYSNHDNNLSFEIELKDNAKILTIANSIELKKLPYLNTGYVFSEWICLDFERLSKHYDAIEVLISNDRSLYCKMYGWDCDSILVMNKSIIKEHSNVNSK